MVIVFKCLFFFSVNDFGIWVVRCKEGKECEVVFFIICCVEERFGIKNELFIIVVFECVGFNFVMKGYVYIEVFC